MSVATEFAVGGSSGTGVLDCVLEDFSNTVLFSAS